MQTIFVIAGPTNGGKDTVIHRLIKMPELGLTRVVTTNSRAPRPGEVDGVHYHFVTRDEFVEGVKRGDFLEWAHVHNDYKGNTYRAFEAVGPDKSIILQMDVKGFETYRAKLSGKYRIVGIFLMPPNMQTLKDRMIARGGDLYDMDIRLDTAKKEMACAWEFDYIVMNKDLEHCMSEIIEIIKSEG